MVLARELRTRLDSKLWVLALLSTRTPITWWVVFSASFRVSMVTVRSTLRFSQRLGSLQKNPRTVFLPGPWVSLRYPATLVRAPLLSCRTPNWKPVSEVWVSQVVSLQADSWYPLLARSPLRPKSKLTDWVQSWDPFKLLVCSRQNQLVGRWMQRDVLSTLWTSP